MTRRRALILAITPFITMWPFFYVVKVIIPIPGGQWWEWPYMISVFFVAILHVVSLMAGLVHVTEPRKP